MYDLVSSNATKSTTQPAGTELAFYWSRIRGSVTIDFVIENDRQPVTLRTIKKDHTTVVPTATFTVEDTEADYTLPVMSVDQN